VVGDVSAEARGEKDVKNREKAALGRAELPRWGGKGPRANRYLTWESTERKKAETKDRADGFKYHIQGGERESAKWER